MHGKGEFKLKHLLTMGYWENGKISKVVEQKDLNTNQEIKENKKSENEKIDSDKDKN